MSSAFSFNFFENETNVKDNSKTEVELIENSFGDEIFPGEVSGDSYKIVDLPLKDGSTLKIISNPDPKKAGLNVAIDKDVVTNVYEGGFKLWECARYLLDFLVNQNIDFTGRSVLELGCGAGIDGILTLLNGAKRVVFQDYNKEVLQGWTIPNVRLNDCEAKQLLQASQFFYGDWGSLAENCNFILDKFDIILLSETIYVRNSYFKQKKLLANALKPDGVAFLAAKVYYFGTGGSIKEFTDFLETCHPDDPYRFQVSTELEINEGVRCAICSIRWIN